MDIMYVLLLQERKQISTNFFIDIIENILLSIHPWDGLADANYYI